MALFPQRLRQAAPDVLEITWNDGHLSLYPVVYLRRSCRCAACVDEWSGKPILDPGKIAESVRPIEINPVGRYALSFNWSDGHSSGIYTFEHLRSICPCAECRKESTVDSRQSTGRKPDGRVSEDATSPAAGDD